MYQANNKSLIESFFFKKILVIFIFLFAHFSGQAQNSLPEHANQQIENTQDQNAKVDTILKYAQKLYSNGHFDNAFELALEGLELAKKISKSSTYSNFEITIARCYNRQNNVEKALEYGRRAIQHTKPDNLENLSFLYNIHSLFFIKANIMDSALYFNYFSDSLMLLSTPKRRFITLSARSDIYEKQGLNDLATETNEKAIDVVMKYGTDIEKLWIIYDIKELYAYTNNAEKYGYYTKKYLELSAKRDSSKNFHKGTFTLDYKSLGEQIEIVEKVVEYYRTSYYTQGYNLGLEKLAKLYIENEEYEKAYKTILIHEPIIRQTNFENSLLQFYSRKYDLEKKLGLTEKAITTVDKVLELRDSVQSFEVAKQTLELSEKYESQAKDQEITILNKENELKDLYIQRSNITKWLFGTGVFLLLLFSYYLYQNVRSKKRTNAILANKNAIIQDNLIEKETLLKEIHHRVKNNLQIISSLLRLQSRSIEDPSTKEALLDGQNRVQSMALIHQNLYKEDNLTGVEVKKYFENLCQNLLATYHLNDDSVQLDLDISAISLDVSTLIPMGLIVNELFTNSIKYAFEGEGPYILGASLKEMDQQLHLVVYDNGKGISEDLIQYLNGSSGRSKNKKWGFGTRLLQSFAQKLEATISAKNNDGTQISLVIKNYKIV